VEKRTTCRFARGMDVVGSEEEVGSPHWVETIGAEEVG